MIAFLYFRLLGTDRIQNVYNVQVPLSQNVSPSMGSSRNLEAQLVSQNLPRLFVNDVKERQCAPLLRIVCQSIEENGETDIN